MVRPFVSAGAVKISQYCSVCKAVLEMSVVPTAEGDEDGVMWLRCPQCQGFLPKFSAGLSTGTDAAADESARDDRGATGEKPPGTVAPDRPTEAGTPDAEPPAPLEFDPAQAVPYRPWDSYPVGAVVHHLAWDDYGVVLAKESLPGKRRAVRVRFERAGEVRLIEESDEGL